MAIVADGYRFFAAPPDISTCWTRSIPSPLSRSFKRRSFSLLPLHSSMCLLLVRPLVSSWTTSKSTPAVSTTSKSPLHPLPVHTPVPEVSTACLPWVISSPFRHLVTLLLLASSREKFRMVSWLRVIRRKLSTSSEEKD